MANLKARDLEGVCKTYGFEQGVLRILTHLLERINDNEAAVTVCGQMQDKQADMMGDIVTIAGNMKDMLEMKTIQGE